MPRRSRITTRRYTVENHLRVESLEGRIVLTAGIGYDGRTGILSIIGSEGADTAEVRVEGRTIVAVLASADGPATKTLRASAVRSIAFTGLGGDDSFTNSTAIRSRADGGRGADVLRGGTSSDQLFGGDDDDQLFGNRGDDLLDGGDGDDDASGGAGADRLLGGAGFDSLLGEDGNDTIGGGDDDDFLDGGIGNDVCRGDDGMDHLLGGVGADVLQGGLGDDTCDGGLGNDREYGESGDDDLHGSDGDDFMSGGIGNDHLFGDAGRDSLLGDDGDDHLDGNTGRDRIVGGQGLDREDDADDRFEDGDEDGDGYDDDHGRPVDPAIVAPITFSDVGTAQLSGTSANEDSRQYYSFTATADKTLTVALATSVTGRYADLQIRDTTTGREMMELEPADDGRSTGQVRVVADHTYLFRVKADSNRYAVDYTIDLLLDDSVPAAPSIGTAIGFDAAGVAQLIGTSTSEKDKSFFSFTATADGTLGVTLVAGTDGRYADLKLKEMMGSSDRDLLELEPGERAGRTTGSVTVVTGRTYVFEIKSPFDRIAVDFTVNLQLS